MSSDESSGSLARVSAREPIVIGRYVLSAELARGGMATVYVGRLHGEGGFRRIVAVKRLHAQFRTDGDLSTMFLDEARVAARIRHPNVVHAIDVALHDGEMFIVMEYVEGASLSQLMRTLGRRNELVPLPVACAVVTGLLHGLHAAHEAVDEQGLPLGIVHRDVSPQNVLVGTDGIARVLDFGVAKAVGQAHVTREGEIKGKLAYMAPEQLTAGSEGLTRSADVFAAGIILWELLTGRRLFYGSNDGETVRRLLDAEIPPPSTLNDAIPPELDDVVLRALERDVTRRFATAAEMAAQLEAAIPPAGARQVGDWVRALAADALATRAELLLQAESSVTIAGVAAARTPGEPRPAPRRWVWALAALGSVALVGVGWGASSMVRPAPQVGAGLDASPPPSSAAPGPAASELALVQAPVPSAASSAPVVASSIATASASAATPILKGRPSPKPRSAPSAPIYSRD